MQVYNTLTNKKEEFIPITADEIKIYVCGPTVYNFFHIGNARPFVVFDTLRRFLEYMGKNVKFIQNFTDIDDKIINKAKEEGVGAAEVSERYIDEYFKDAASLGVRLASEHPRVTENIPEIISFISRLIDRGYAYERNGDVYFRTKAFKDYGKLSGQDIDALQSGARISIDEEKDDPLDFALWKAKKADGEPSWPSPWGEGRPGWHIECSALSKKYLGETIDIHAGGQDLIFPHHENEIAQSEAASGKQFANYFMHNGYIMIDDKKMSKSEGNFFTVRDILKNYRGEVVRYFLLSGHYRSPINFSKDLLDDATAAVERMHNAKDSLEFLAVSGWDEVSDEENVSLEKFPSYKARFVSVMEDDLNTAQAIGVIFEFISFINKQIKGGASKQYAKEGLSLLLELTNVLGLLEQEKSEENKDDDDKINAIVEERQTARASKNWQRADEIRDELKAMGLEIKDTPQGPQIIKI